MCPALCRISEISKRFHSILQNHTNPAAPLRKDNLGILSRMRKGHVMYYECELTHFQARGSDNKQEAFYLTLISERESSKAFRQGSAQERLRMSSIAAWLST